MTGIASKLGAAGAPAVAGKRETLLWAEPTRNNSHPAAPPLHDLHSRLWCSSKSSRCSSYSNGEYNRLQKEKIKAVAEGSLALVICKGL